MWVDNIKMDLRGIGWGGMDWIDLADDRDQCKALVNTVMNFQVPQNVWKFLSSCATGGFSRRFQSMKLVSKKVNLFFTLLFKLNTMQ
jgi:hypothetical protein